ncbi:MAG: M14 family metallopeptidase, partial [Acidobacteriota bacterium]
MIRSARPVLSLLLLLALRSPAAAAEAPLPPEIPWEGKSLSLVAPDDDPWITPAERTGLRATPRYDETLAWLQRLAAAAPEISLVSLGRSPEGREIWMAVVSKEGAATPEALRRSGRPAVLAQAGIHAGEIDGKDAGLMLLRDLTVGGSRRDLLERVSFLFIPILNVDGHERFSAYGRVNQRGPEEMGWRTTARNLNLNRDYTKLDAPEMRALIGALNAWAPDLYLDLHVTDGADYQYDATFGYNGSWGYSPAIAAWLDTRLAPRVREDLESWGHIPGPLVFPSDWGNPAGGIVEWTAGPRFSNGYGDARHLPTVLLENHSLKPYRQRVLGTYVFLWSVLDTAGRHGDELREATRRDREARPPEIPLAFGAAAEPSGTVTFLGVERRVEPSPVSGEESTVWTGVPVELEVSRMVMSRPLASVRRPAAYWIPPAWQDVVERLEWHGIRVERIAEPRTLEVGMYRLSDAAAIAREPFEGHARVEGEVIPERRTETFPPGSARVPTDQPLGELAVLLLEPDSPDSFLRWGFFLEILQRTEYIEGYVIDPLG